jgi:hypothetical protein
VIKRDYDPATPHARALTPTSVDVETKTRLRTTDAKLDPIALLAEVRAAQAELGHRVDRRSG